MTEPAWGPAEVPRDGFGRPRVKPLDAGPGLLPPERLTSYTRCTTYVGCLEDNYNLGQWQKRKVAEGLAARPDLLLRVNSLGAEPDRTRDAAGAKRWKGAMDAVAEEALQAAKASAKATIGTALHALTERIDRGEDVGVVPDQYRPHLAAYARATERFRPVHIEQFSVHDGLQIGGTPDRVIAIDGEDGLFIADLKTGDTDFGVGKIAMQLAVYSRSVIYDPATQERRPYAGVVNQDRGLVIALNAGTGVVELKWVDLAAGWEAVQLATEVRRWRSRRGLARPYGPTVSAKAEESQPSLTRTAEAALLTSIERASSAEELVDLWRAAGAAWTPEHTARASARKAELLRAA